VPALRGLLNPGWRIATSVGPPDVPQLVFRVDERRILKWGLHVPSGADCAPLTPAEPEVVMARRQRLSAIAALSILVLAACASGNEHPSPTATTSPIATASAAPSLGPQPTATAVPIATPPPMPFLTPIGPPCTAAQLEIRVGQINGAGGNGIAYLIFTDRGKTPCSLSGTPKVQLLNARGRLLTMPSVSDSSSGYFPTYPNRGVELLPLTMEGVPPGPVPEGGIRGQASLPLQYGQDGCDNSVAAARLEVAGGTFTVPLTIPQPGAHGCEVTRMFVNPFQPAEFLP
jgi:Protein of unknown function (DUF4232)